MCLRIGMYTPCVGGKVISYRVIVRNIEQIRLKILIFCSSFFFKNFKYRKEKVEIPIFPFRPVCRGVSAYIN